MPKTSRVTSLLEQYRQGNSEAIEQVLPLVYRELRNIARKYMRREKSNHTLQPTALVHEAFMQMVAKDEVGWENRAHFFAAAAQMMRWVLLDHAKGKGREKRGGGAIRISFEENLHWVAEEGTDLVALNEALEKLMKLDERRGRVVELRFFGGLSVEETAEVLRTSPATVKRDWTMAKAWLYRELAQNADNSDKR